MRRRFLAYTYSRDPIFHNSVAWIWPNLLDGFRYVAFEDVMRLRLIRVEPRFKTAPKETIGQ